MAVPTWFFGLHRDLQGDTVIAPSGALSIFVDFSDVMEGKVQIEGIGGTVSTINGLEIYVYNSFYTSAETEPIFALSIPMVNGFPKQVSFHLLSGKYFLTLINRDATNLITVNATKNTLSWPS